jgi:hypothetical protein
VDAPYRPLNNAVQIAYVGAIQFELIQPIVDPERLYKDFLPADGTFAMRFHHLGFNQEGVKDVHP